ncbi:MaoC family dehydratase [Leucobacter sp. BZR 635]|uniref:MaoC family dehydratase n=1 Tax=Leucobacter sp. BZR 635 TaxID=3378705 RepID=UPI003A8538A3
MSGRRFEQRGRYFEEFEEGDVFVHAPARTVTEADNVLFTTMTMNPQSLHLDAEWAADTEFGERLVNSMFTLSTMVGLSVAQLTQGTIVANLGMTDIRFPSPMRAGDTMTAETLIVGKRLSQSRPGQGVVEFEHTARDQHGNVVAIARRSTLMLCRPDGASGLGGPEDPEPAAGGAA